MKQHTTSGRRFGRLRWRRPFVLLVCLAALLTAAIGSTAAFLHTKTEETENAFLYGSVSSQVTETFENGVKENVCVKNTGNTSAFLRAMVILTWKNAAGDVSAQPVQDSDVTIDWGSGWQKLGDYWYCTTEVADGAESPALIVKCALSDSAAAPEGYALSVEIIADAVQSQPAQAVQEAWGVSIISGAVAAVSNTGN